MLAWTGFKQVKLANKVEAEPTQIALDDLVANGSDNAHVALGNFYETGQFVYQEGKSGGWAKVWMPIVGDSSDFKKDLDRQLEESGGDVSALVAPNVAGRDIVAVIVSDECRNESDIDRLLADEYVNGIIVNDLGGIPSDAAKELASAYPGIDTGKVLLIDVSRDLPSSGGAMGMLAGGIGLSGAGAAGAVFKGRRKG